MASLSDVSSSEGDESISSNDETLNPTGGDGITSTSTPNAIDRQQSSSNQNQRQCWVCFATQEDDPDPEWVRPCRCRGSTMWVHQKCLQRWVDEKQRGNTFTAVACSSCGYVYMIQYPPSNYALFLMEKLERSITKICPLMTGGIIVLSLYWSSVTYGAVTFMQVVGWERGLELLERADPLTVLVGLPMIPTLLITVKMLRWEDAIVGWVRDRYVASGAAGGRRLPIPPDGPPIRAPQAAANNQAAGAGAAAVADNQAALDQQRVIRDAVSATRVFCGALALPTIAVVVGKMVFGESVTPPWKRALYGAATFLAVRGVSKIYFKYKQMIRQKNRTILSYLPTPPGTPPNSSADLVQQGEDEGEEELNLVDMHVQP